MNWRRNIPPVLRKRLLSDGGELLGMLASFLVHGIIHEELFFETCGEGLMVWEKVRPFISELARQAQESPDAAEPGKGSRETNRLAQSACSGRL